MTEEERRSQRIHAALLIKQQIMPTLVFSPGLGKAPMEYKQGSIQTLIKRLAEYVETGVEPDLGDL